MRSPKDPHYPHYHSQQGLEKTTHCSKILAPTLWPEEDKPGEIQRQNCHFPIAMDALDHILHFSRGQHCTSPVISLPGQYFLGTLTAWVCSPIHNADNIQTTCLTENNNFLPEMEENASHGPKGLFHCHFPCFMYKWPGYRYKSKVPLSKKSGTELRSVQEQH